MATAELKAIRCSLISGAESEVVQARMGEAS